MKMPVWINGSEGGSISPADRGLAYGDGLFETIRIDQGRAIFLDAHLSRLFDSADFLGITVDAQKMRQSFSDFLHQCPDTCIAKIMITRGVSGRGYLPDPAALVTVIFSAHALPTYPAEYATEGVVAIFSTLRLGQQPLLAGHKHLNRLEQVLLRRELAATQAVESLVCDLNGYVVEGVSHNVFMVKEGCLCTPLLDMAGVSGVMRAQLINHASHIGIPVQEGRYIPDDFLAADEIFFCNSVNGIWPVRALSGQDWVAPGSVTGRLQSFWQKVLSH
jgi:4-amino-4-deoxychorismate lyase